MDLDTKVVASLQTAAALLSQLKEQFYVDARQLHAKDVDWLAARVQGWHEHCECHLAKVIDRLLYAGEDPMYSTGNVSGSTTVTAMLTRARDLAFAAFTQMCRFRKDAWDVRADGVTDVFEHIIQRLEKIVFKAERELALIEGLTEAGYVASRLDDAD